MVDRRMKAIYKDEKRVKDFRYGFRRGLRAAAEFCESWEGSTPKHRMGDLILHKFNQTNRKPRKRKTLTGEATDGRG